MADVAADAHYIADDTGDDASRREPRAYAAVTPATATPAHPSPLIAGAFRRHHFAQQRRRQIPGTPGLMVRPTPSSSGCPADAAGEPSGKEQLPTRGHRLHLPEADGTASLTLDETC
ncbi:hypothetical protein [Streptomyces sp. NPDC058086]|uniref:hypothetical protein n=1 Tax=Streptomyces sp. NPDC058086 TaxID=3346334 RepID=UPI0036F0DE16